MSETEPTERLVRSMEFNVQTIRAAIGRDRGSHRARLEAGALRERYERLTL